MREQQRPLSLGRRDLRQPCDDEVAKVKSNTIAGEQVLEICDVTVPDRALVSENLPDLAAPEQVLIGREQLGYGLLPTDEAPGEHVVKERLVEERDTIPVAQQDAARDHLAPIRGPVV